MAIYNSNGGQVTYYKGVTVTESDTWATVKAKEEAIHASKELKDVNVNSGMGTSVNSSTGETQTVENPLIQNSTVANAVAEWTKDILRNRNTLSGNFRPDVRLDYGDKVKVENKYASMNVQITSVHYSYNGAFNGSYEGRVIESNG